MSHNGPTQAHPCGPMASQRLHTVNFFIPTGAGGKELDIHRLHNGPAITSTVCVCVCVCSVVSSSWLNQGEQGHLWGPLWCPHHCVDVKNAAGQHIISWRVNEAIVSLFACFITISNHHMTPACKKMAYIPAMNAQVTNEMPAHHFLITECWF